MKKTITISIFICGLASANPLKKFVDEMESDPVKLGTYNVLMCDKKHRECMAKAYKYLKTDENKAHGLYYYCLVDFGNCIDQNTECFKGRPEL